MSDKAWWLLALLFAVGHVGCAASREQKAAEQLPAQRPEAVASEEETDSVHPAFSQSPKPDAEALGQGIEAAGDMRQDKVKGEARSAVRPQPSLDSGPDVDELDRKLDQAIGLVANLQYDQAEPILRPLVADYGKVKQPDKAALAMFWLAYCLEKQSQTDSAMVLYREVIRSHDGTRAATQAARRLEQLSREG
jgi:TolA-binding protein